MPEQYDLELDEETIQYHLTYSKRRRTVGITVHRDLKITVRAPHGLSLKNVHAMVKEKSSWIGKQLRKFKANPLPPPRVYKTGEAHWFMGKSYNLFIIQDEPEGVTVQDNQLVLTVKNAADNSQKEKVYKRWQRQEAKRIFAERLMCCYQHVEQLSIPYPDIYVRDMKTRWGSCSGVADRINLNLKLVQVPLDLIDYVIIHELCHFRERNHSKDYYALLASILPDWEARRRLLNELEVH